MDFFLAPYDEQRVLCDFEMVIRYYLIVCFPIFTRPYL